MNEVAGELIKIAKELLGKSGVIGEKVTFSADSFQMPFEVPDSREHRYTGKIIAEKGDILTVKLFTPSFASGKTMKISYREETLEIG